MQSVTGEGIAEYPRFDIVYPEYGQLVSGLVQVTGSAGEPDFASYLLQVSDPYAGWQLLASSTEPVADGILGTWSSGTAQEGKYGLRLVVTDNNGNQYYDYVEVEVDNITADLSMSNQISGDYPVEILGNASANYGSFDQFILEYGEGLEPSIWQTERITLAGDGTLPVENGLLGFIDPQGMAPGYYVIRLTVFTSQGAETVAQVVNIDPNMVSGFPLQLQGSLYGAIGVANLDATDESKEILLGTSRGSQGFGKDGSHLFTLDTDIVYNDEKLIGPNGIAIGELGAGPGLEYAYFFKDWARLHVADKDVFLPGFPVSLASRDVSHPHTNQVSTMLYDVTGDGNLEIINPAVSYWDNQLYLHVTYSNGNPVEGFPFIAGYPNVFAMRAGAVGDLDGDERPEIFFTAAESQGLNYDFIRATLFAVDDSGQLLPAFPLEFRPVAGGVIDLGDIQIADLNQDGQKEIIFIETSSNKSADLYRFAVHVLDKSGRELPGWPFTLEGSISDVGTAMPAAGGTLAIGDLTGDGIPELAVMPNFGPSGYAIWGGIIIRVLDNNGNELYAISNIHRSTEGTQTMADVSGLLIADVTGNGQAELLTSRRISPGAKALA